MRIAASRPKRLFRESSPHAEELEVDAELLEFQFSGRCGY
jgi:hypothetical protein